VVGFAGMAAALAVALVAGTWWASRRIGEPPALTARAVRVTALAVLAWLALTGGLAASGILLDFERRMPPFLLTVGASAALVVAFGLSPAGTRLVRGLPLAVLVGFQVFRLPLEVLMDLAYREGVMPVQMSFEGWNFDILTGASAGVVALLVARGRLSHRVVAVWNVAGLGLLANIVTIAALSTPRFAAFGPDRLNVWIAYPPFVWLPEVMVMAALLGHVLVFRRLRGDDGFSGRGGATGRRRARAAARPPRGR